MHEAFVQLEREWDRCAQWIEPSLEYSNGCFDMPSIKSAVFSGKAQLWPGERAAMVTEIAEYPLRTGCVVMFAGGDLDELRAMRLQVEQWAKQRGCDFISAHGRKGWVRALGVGRIVSTYSARDL